MNLEALGPAVPRLPPQGEASGVMARQDPKWSRRRGVDGGLALGFMQDGQALLLHLRQQDP
jgi:hypothetical protein